MATNIILTNASGTQVTAVSLTSTDPGVASAATAFRIFNDDTGGAVDTATEPTLYALQIDDATDEAVMRGLRAVDERWLEIRALGTGSAGSTQQATGWQPWGRGLPMIFEALASGDYHDFEVRYVPPTDAPDATITFSIGVDPDGGGVALEHGHTERLRDGVIWGIGLGDSDQLLAGGDMTASGSPDNNVNFPDLTWVHDGIPQQLLAHAVALDGNDGNSIALAATEAYWARISLGSASSVQVTKSAKFVEAAKDTDDVPAVPSGEINLGYVLRAFDATIETADITSQQVIGGLEITTSAASLIATFGPAWFRIDNTFFRTQVERNLTLTASSTNTVWVLPDRDVTFSATTDGSRPEIRAYKVAEITTDSTGVTGVTNYVDPVGSLCELQFEISGALSATNTAFAAYPHNREGYVLPINGFVLSVGDNGTGNTAGELRVTVSIDDQAGGWTTLFTSSGSDDRRPRLDYNDSDPFDTAARPEVLFVHPFARFKAEVAFPTAYDVDAPDDLIMTMRVAVT